MRIEPGLLRAARMRLPAEAADVGTEYDAWTDARVRARSSVAMVLDADVAHGLRAGWAQEDEECRSDFVRLLESWHAPALPEVWAEEIIGLAALDPESIDPRQVEWAELLLSLAAGDITRGTSDSDALERWLVRAAPRLPDGIWTKPELGTKLVQAWRRAHRESVDARHPLGIGPEAISTYRFEPTRWTARQVGGVLELAPSRGPSKGADAHGGAEAAGSSWVADIWMSEPGVAAGGSGGTSGRKLDTNARTRFPIPRPDPSGSNGAPPWAVESGINSFGRWARAEIAGVSLRFRWIEPGTFFMGSPEDEWGRYDDEIRHEVELTQGFWLAETPCTQRLWIEVMGDRPGSSVGDEIPVTDVSWDEVQSFLERVGRDYGELRLPSEAEWEYACRGGTGRSTYAGDLNEANQAGVLDPIAWWSGSRVSSAQPVGLKASNPLGLFDMLGNVYEWCSDHVSDLRDLVDSGEERRVNPRGRAGRLRVIRGGSWLGHPQGVRAAYRFAGHPGYRNGGLGFRLARGQDLRSSPSSGEAARGAGRAADAELPRGTTSGHRWRTDLGSWSFDWIEKPAWAHAAGRDAFGLWATLKIGVVEQRMRWIAPGRFRMGSPDDEGGRFDREPLHEVAIRSGYWLAETPCTQALWAEVLAGDQPFRFHDPRLPVESVTFEDVQRFIWSLPGQGADGFEFRLPTEAEWEHACRAGVDRARYGELDDVAWHAGNSGRTTRPVGALRANPWGLHDMLGNVFEWCLDRVANYSDPPVLPGGSGLAVDPIETFGEQRVIRGGSWFDHPQYVRAAYRYADHPGRRSGDLGFRLARGQGVRPSQGKFKRDAERGAGRAAEASPGRTVD
ncbi:MAG: formylglycine-generating enzyme family protein [Planctomycetota bacterium]